MKTIILKSTEVECLMRRVLEEKISQLNSELKASELRFQSLQYKAISQSFDNIEEELEFDALPEMQQAIYWDLEDLKAIIEQL
mgnify:CR=1 FL=1